MKLRRAKREIETGGALDHKEYSVRLDAHLMELLSNLYSDPVWAVVREYWTNGQDGMMYLKRQGEDPKPIEIHVPNDIEPWFEVRDYGIGMSHETIWEVYTQYGNSTKNDNNDDVGGLGIGAKAGFCYEDGGDQWTITSVFDGMTRVYIAAKNDRGMPTLTLLSETETPDAHTGIAVRIPVPTSDIKAFKAAVSRFSRRALGEFVIKGDVRGVQEGLYDPLEYTSKGERYGWRPNGSGERGVIAVMGGVPYPIDLNRSEFGLSSYEKGTLEIQGSADLFFKVGELDIAPSREALSYTPHTVALIKARLPELFQSMTRDFYEALRKQPTLWDALKYTEANKNKKDIIRKHYKKGGDIKWNDHDLTSHSMSLKISLDKILEAFPEDKRPDPLKFTVTKYSRDYYGSGISKDETFRTKAYFENAYQEQLADNPNAQKDKFPNDSVIISYDEFKTNYPVYLVADCTHAKTVARQFLKERSGYGALRHIYLIEADIDIDPKVIQGVFQGVQVASLDSHTKHIQEELERKRESSRSRSIASFRGFAYGNWEETAVDETIPQVYVKINSNQVDPEEVPDWFKPQAGTSIANMDARFAELMSILFSLGVVEKTNYHVIGVPKTRWDELAELDHWESFWEKYKKDIHNWMNRGVPDTPLQVNEWLLNQEVKNLSFYQLAIELEQYGLMPSTGYFAQFYEKAQGFKEEVDAYVKKAKQYTDIVRLRKLIRGKVDGRTLKRVPTLDTKSFDGYNTWLRKKYPLLYGLSHGSRYERTTVLKLWQKENDNPIEEYIRSMDRTRSELNKTRPSL